MQLERLKELSQEELQTLESELEDLLTSRAWQLVKLRLRSLEQQETRSSLSSLDPIKAQRHAGAALAYQNILVSPQDMVRDVRTHITEGESPNA